MAARSARAYEDFRRSATLMPWIPLPLEAQASSALQLAGAAGDPASRLDLLRQGEAALARERQIAPLGGTAWALSAQLAFARFRAGDRTGLQQSLDAFENAVRFRPRDAELLGQWALAWLEAKDPAR